MIKIFPYVIIYPLAIELFAFLKTHLDEAIDNKSCMAKTWTTFNQKRGCKKLCDHYNASPSLKVIDAQSEALKFELEIFDRVRRLLALINFA